MKILITFLLGCCLSTAAAQTTRSIRFHTFPKDSINLHLDENYFLIEDSCSSVIRYGHYNFKDHKFFGAFKDVNKLDPQIVLSEGNYTADGLLDGDFKLHYLNGDLQAAGRFDKGKMTGHWVVYNPGNSKKLEFENNGNDTRILNAWDDNGKQVVIEGKGFYISVVGTLAWEGKLVNGKPDGTWRLKMLSDRTGVSTVSETFKNGVFSKGSTPLGTYKDASRITLIDNNMLPVSNASLMRMSMQSCDPSKSRKKIVMAVYRNGSRAFNDEIKRVIAPVFSKIDLQYHANKEFTIQGMVDEKGKVTSLKYVNTFDDPASHTLLNALYRLPFLEPTLVDGKPVASVINFKFTFTFNQYLFSWRMVPPAQNE